jgi:predicted transcriptional regulator
LITGSGDLAEEAAGNPDQIAEIAAGLAEANRGEFASAADLAAVVAKYVDLPKP